MIIAKLLICIKILLYLLSPLYSLKIIYNFLFKVNNNRFRYSIIHIISLYFKTITIFQ